MKKLCAVIISYNGNERIAELVKILSNEADEILIVDNGSNTETISRLEVLGQKFDRVNVQFLGRNMGIAFAMNVGLQYAAEQNYKWLITFDQDTIPERGAVKKLLGHAERYAKESGRNVSFGPQLAITDNVSAINKKMQRGCRKVNYLITSGNLSLTEAVQKAGGWTNELFIDSVDYDFSLKLRSCGYRLWRCYDCVMMHQFGETNESGVKNTHNKLRKYFMVRNHKYILKKYFLKYPGYCCFSTAFFIKGIFRWIITEKNRKELLDILKSAIKADARTDYEKQIYCGGEK